MTCKMQGVEVSILQDLEDIGWFYVELFCEPISKEKSHLVYLCHEYTKGGRYVAAKTKHWSQLRNGLTYH